MEVIMVEYEYELNGGVAGLPYNLVEILGLLKTIKCSIEVGHMPYRDRRGSYFYCQLIFDNNAYYELDEDQLEEVVNHMATAFLNNK